jgi:alkylhydroperoxidase family enzyme
MNLLYCAILAVLSLMPTHRFPAAGRDDAWTLLPRENPPLPAWARVLIKPLPRTTGAMLDLDRLHRADNPLGPLLAAKLRWLVADTMNCEYARATAMADLRTAGATSDETRRLTANAPAAEEKPLFSFARQITKAAYAVTDDEFATLLRRFGPENMTAIVHTLAFANFQNRIILALGVKIEPDGPCPPLAMKLDAKRRAMVPTPPRPGWDRVISAKPAKSYGAPADWKDATLTELEKALSAQQARKPRVPMPDPSRFANLNPDVTRQAQAIVWTRVCAGYQPVMTQTWFIALREFQQEAKLDRVFASSLFWVVTRTNDCFY